MDSVIDRAVFTKLGETVGDDFLPELVDAFLEEAPGLLGQLRRALATADADAWRRAAHSLKSNGNTFGALTFAELARAAELSGMSGDAAADTATADALDAAYSAAAEELQRLAHG